MRFSGYAESSSSAQMKQKNTATVNPFIARPATYYGDGPFDPPSSDDDEEEVDSGRHSSEANAESVLLLNANKSGPSSPGRAERGDQSPHRTDAIEKKTSSVRILALVLISLVALSAFIGIIAGFTYSGASIHAPGTRKITMDDIFSGTFYAAGAQVNWVPEAGDGVFSLLEDSYIKLVDLTTNTTTNVVSLHDITDEHGRPLAISHWQPSPDMKYLLVKTDYRKQWRWSSYGNFYVHNIDAKTTYPIVPPTNPATTAYATWSPTGHAIAFVNNNDLYVLPSADPNTAPIQVTTAGNASLFHGVPDWVYEEEIFSADFALWWSPDSLKVAFLVFDETAVKEYTFPIYNPTDDANTINPYTSEMTMKYPKPGFDNPLVSVHIFDLALYQAHNDGSVNNGFPLPDETLTLDWDGRHPVEDSVIMEVAWVGNSSLIVKEVNRNADDGSVVLFDLNTQSRTLGKVVRKLGKYGEEGDDGWIDCGQSIYPLPPGLTAVAGTDTYLDIVPNHEGFNHIALFSSASSDTPRFLTTGPWEVTGNIQGVDAKKGLIYFTAARPSTERHIFSVPIPTISSEKLDEPIALTDVTKPSFYSAKFSPQAGFYVLAYRGPGTPWHKIIQTDNSSFTYELEMNERLRNTTLLYETPTITTSTIMNDGYELNTMELRPPRMDDSGRTKYPVLFRVYGGPESQLVDLTFRRDWHHYVACSLQYIVVIIDGRGTGFKGRKLRNPVKGNLGFFETIDQIAAANRATRAWAQKPYVDPKRIGIWGWSYGGFMSSKVIEADAKIHSLAMAVAPVVSWALYDSIYTERYMNLPQKNPGGYINASVTDVTGFRNIDFLLAHGSGDDNVHFANSAHLLDMFTSHQIRNFRFRMFTDSDHGINRRGAQREIYEYLTAFLVERWGKGGRRRM